MFIGLMSGTSMDAVDCVLVDFHEQGCTLVEALHYPISEALKKTTRAFIQEQCIPFDALGKLERAFGELFAETVLHLLKKTKTPSTAIHAIGSHGQTIWHNPRGARYTLQVGDPHYIAARTNITTVADFRRVDLALGGEGAPLVPRFHAAMFQAPKQDRVVINIGGICNITILPAESTQVIQGWDIGPGNAILDALAGHYFEQPHDFKGSTAASGTVHTPLLQVLLEDPYFQRQPPKSTGKEYFHLAWLHHHIDKVDPALFENKADLLATATELTAILIAHTVHALFTKAEVLICGGGVFNEHLMQRIQFHLGENYPVHSTASYGLDPRWVEATCFAWLAKRRLQGLPGNLPSVTGASKEAVLGAIYTI